MKNGLTDKEVKASRETYGENKLSKKKRKGFFRSFLESFADPIIKILLIALAVNIIFVFHQANWLESAGIALAILLATFVSTLSEYGSESAFEKLQEEASRINCRVYRAKGLIQIPIDQIVVGDIVLLQPGDRIPADGVIVDGILEVDQSCLNGESKGAEKFPSRMTQASSQSTRPVKLTQSVQSEATNLLSPSLLFSGTTVCSGEGIMQVTKVGDATFYGEIGAELQGEKRESPLRVRLSEFAGSIGKFGYIAALFTAFAFLFNVIVIDNRFDQEAILRTLTDTGLMLPYVLRAITLSVTVIVMAVPEGLPMMITVVLSANMKRMLKDNVLVRKLVGIETAGSLNILFTDKTGTLTKGRLDVTHFISGNGKVWDKKGIVDEKFKLKDVLSNSIFHNNAASMSKNGAIGGNATDRAALEFAIEMGSVSKQDINKVFTIPFSSETKYMATVVSGDMNATLIKGAPEKILPYCTQYYDENATLRSFMDKRKVDSILKDFASKAIRVIAVAVSEPVSEVKGSAKDKVQFKGLKLVGLLGIRDDIRGESIKGIQQVQSAGIQTVMITGDSPVTAQAIARELGIIKTDSDIVITSDELKGISDDEISRLLPRIKVIARALPSDKSRLVRIAQANNLVVGMTGDGVNDAPALKQADIGFAMGSGTEVAKESGDIVILDDNILSIAKAIRYGRTIFKSIRKFIIYQLSISMCAAGVTVIAPLMGVDFPITIIQMLWINIVMDTLAGMAFSGEKAREKYMKEPPKKRNEPILNGYMKGQIAVNSIYTIILCLFFLRSPIFRQLVGTEGYIYQMTAFFALFMFIAIFTSFCARTHHINLLEYLSSNKAFIFIMGIVTIIQVTILYFGGNVFRTVTLDPNDVLLVVGLALTIIPVDITRKWVLSKFVGVKGT